MEKEKRKYIAALKEVYDDEGYLRETAKEADDIEKDAEWEESSEDYAMENVLLSDSEYQTMVEEAKKRKLSVLLRRIDFQPAIFVHHGDDVDDDGSIASISDVEGASALQEEPR